MAFRVTFHGRAMGKTTWCIEEFERDPSVVLVVFSAFERDRIIKELARRSAEKVSVQMRLKWERRILVFGQRMYDSSRDVRYIIDNLDLCLMNLYPGNIEATATR